MPNTAGHGWRFNVVLRQPGDVSVDAGGMGLWPGRSAVVSVGEFSARRAGAGVVRRALLSWRMAAIKKSVSRTWTPWLRSVPRRRFSFSTYGLFFPSMVGHTYFMESRRHHHPDQRWPLAGIAMASSHAAQAVRRLLTLAPATARRLRGRQDRGGSPRFRFGVGRLGGLASRRPHSGRRHRWGGDWCGGRKHAHRGIGPGGENAGQSSLYRHGERRWAPDLPGAIDRRDHRSGANHRGR